MRAYKIGLLNNVKTSTPSCQACMGKWTGDLAATLGGTALDIVGTCGHDLSKTAPTSGTYAAGAANPVTIDWPATEIRLFQVDVTQSLTQDASALGLTAPVQRSIMPAFRRDSDGIVAVVLSEFSSSTSTGALYLISTTDNTIAGAVGAAPLSTTAATTSVQLGIRGDGSVVMIADGQSVSLPAFSANDTVTPLAEIIPLAGAWTGDVASSVVTDAANITTPNPVANVYDMKDMCGDLISHRDPEPQCVRPLTGYSFDYQGQPYFRPLLISGQTVELNDLGYEVYNRNAYDTLVDYFSIDWPVSEIRGMVYQTLSRDDDGGSILTALVKWGTSDFESPFDGFTKGEGVRVNSVYDGTDTTYSIISSGVGNRVDVILSGLVNEVFLGIAGDRSLWLLENGNHHKLMVTLGGVPTPLLYNMFENSSEADYKDIRKVYFTVSNPQTDTMVSFPKLRLITKAADMGIVIPDMSADGITSVKDFCGNTV